MWAASSEKGTRPVTIARDAEAQAGQPRVERAAVRDRAHHEQAHTRVEAAARATARATVSTRFSRVTRPKVPTTKSSAADSVARPQRVDGRGLDGQRLHRHGDAHDLRARDLGARPRAP